MPDQPFDDYPVRIELNSQQRTQAYRHGYVELTTAQAQRAGAIVRGRLGGRYSRNLEMCACGCGLSLARARRRHPSRAAAAPGRGAGRAGAAVDDTLPSGKTEDGTLPPV